MKAVLIVVVIGVIVVGLLGAVLFVVGDTNTKQKDVASPEGRYVMDISGRATYGLLGITGWSLNHPVHLERMMNAGDVQGLDVLSALLSGWIHSGDIVIRADLASPTGKVYTQTQDLQNFDTFSGEGKDFNLVISYIIPNSSPFSLTIKLLEDGTQRGDTVSFSGISMPPANA